MKSKSKVVEMMSPGKPPPQDLFTEEIVLGSILIDCNILDDIFENFSEKLFFKANHVTIATYIIKLYKSNVIVDLITLAKILKEEGELDSVGGISYISGLTKHVGSSLNVESYVRILQEHALKRTLIEVSSIILKESYQEGTDVFDLYSKSQTYLDNALKSVITYKLQKVGDVHEEILKESLRILDKHEFSGVPTGLKRIDNLTNGWQNSDLIIIAGRPGMGKSAFGLSLLIEPAINQKIPVAFFSLEMSKQQVVSRLQSSISGVNLKNIVKKKLKIEEINQISTKAASLKDAPIYIDDTANISILDFKSKCRKLVKENGVKMIVLDYLQLMRSGMKTSSREQEIAEISRGLKIVAKELNVPILALAQLSRSVESRGGDKKPMLSDLRESGQIEQDADMVAFCYRADYYGYEESIVGNKSYSSHDLFTLIIAKHRNGELGEVPLKFIAHLAKIDNHDDDVTINSNTFVQSERSNTVNPETPKLSSLEEFSELLSNQGNSFSEGTNEVKPTSFNDKSSDVIWDFDSDSGDAPF